MGKHRYPRLPPLRYNPTKAAVGKYLSYCFQQGLSSRTVNQYGTTLDHLLRLFPAKRSLAEFGQGDIQDYVDYRLMEKIAPSGVRAELTRLGTFFRWAQVHVDPLIVNPVVKTCRLAPGVSIDILEASTHRSQRVLDEVARILDLAPVPTRISTSAS